MGKIFLSFLKVLLMNRCNKNKFFLNKYNTKAITKLKLS